MKLSSFKSSWDRCVLSVEGIRFEVRGGGVGKSHPSKFVSENPWKLNLVGREGIGGERRAEKLFGGKKLLERLAEVRKHHGSRTKLVKE
ncbi:hypothetical protein RRG08_049914 [Elysia crispata]|uniref:Uncharacterized protein n=1 Tax=Elysia crispata TaxID=231223 RepID=A0AAE0XZS6_9GAST|nr:hypothetical protein RRG08_049914 [Elysia crispata]